MGNGLQGHRGRVEKVKSETAVLFGAVVIGFVLVPPLARANASLVNGFLFLILFASLLMHRDVWLPHLATVSRAAGGSGTGTIGAKLDQYAPPPAERDYQH